MKFPVAAFMVAFGYALAYYGIEKFVAYKPNVITTELEHPVAPLTVLLGFLKGPNSGPSGYKGSTVVPFSFQTTDNSVQHLSNSTVQQPSGGVTPL